MDFWFVWKKTISDINRSTQFADPSDSNVVSYELGLLDELVAGKYNFDGLNLDYIRYAGAWDCPEKGCKWLVNPTAIEDFVKTVRKRYPKIILSADLFPRKDVRIAIGQNGIIGDLDIAIDMAYTKFAISNSYEISLNEMKKDYPNAHIVPLLRGWIVGKRDLTLISGLKADVNIAKSFSKDWGIFTYESLLIQSGRSLSEILKEVE